MRKIFVIFVLLSSFIFKLQIMGYDQTELFIKKGKISSNGFVYNYKQTDFVLNIKNNKNEIIFYNECKNNNETILSFGYSEIFDTFFVLKSKFNEVLNEFNLYFETDNIRMLINDNISKAFYTPALIETDNGVFIAYINDNRSIIIYNLLKNQIKFKLESENTIMSLELINIDEQKSLIFKELYGTKYRKIEILIKNLFKKDFSYKDEKDRSFISKTSGTKNIASINDLQYNKFIGFGDSITYGTIGRDSAPELGYIPRLLTLLQAQLYISSELVNEGIPGSKTSEGLERIESVLRNHKGKYILVHYGANDMANTDIPLDSVKENINKMMKIVLNFKMKPILTTLIPGNGDRNGSGRYGGAKYVYRSEMISEGIRDIASSKNIPIIDLEQIYKNYPDNDGGYMSLMSGELHPSEKGYQLMAEKWIDTLLDYPPINISELLHTPTIGLRSSIQWTNSPELDVVKYKISYGFSANAINRVVYSNLSSYTFIITPMLKSIYKKIFFRVYPVDNRDNASTYSPIFVIDLNKKKNINNLFKMRIN